MSIFAGIIGDVVVIAFGARGHMPAKRLCSAVLNRRHHFELAQADVTGIGLPECRAVPSKNVSDLQCRAGQCPRQLLQASFKGLILQASQHLVRADRILDGFGGDVGVLCCGGQLGMTQQDLDHPNISVRLQQMRGEAVS